MIETSGVHVQVFGMGSVSDFYSSMIHPLPGILCIFIPSYSSSDLGIVIDV